jgi:hypothetical protein
VDVGVGGTWYGNTCAMNDDYQGTCTGTTSPDVVYMGTLWWPMTVQIDTSGSSYDTVLYVRRDDCYGPEVGCDDDGGGWPASSLTLSLEAGTYYIFVDGWSSSSCGDYVLNVRPMFGPGP